MTDPDFSYFDVYYRVVSTRHCVVEVQARTKEEAEDAFLQNWQQYHENANVDHTDNDDLLDVQEVSEL